MSGHPSTNTVQYDNLLILRGIACLAVVLDHLANPIFSRIPGEEGVVLSRFVPRGFEPVWLFFMLSSFLLTKALLSGRFSSTWDFYLTRAKRLLPAFYFFQLTIILLVICNIVSWPVAVDSHGEVIREFSILLFAPWTPYIMASASLNSPIWSVVVEVHFIALLPFLVARLKSDILFFRASIVAWCVLLGYFSLAQIPVWPKWYETHIYNLAFFVFGMLAALKKNNESTQPKKIIAMPYIAFLAFLFVDCMSHFDIDVALRIGPLLLAPAFYFLLISIDTEYQKKLPRNYRELLPAANFRSVLESVGAMSYSIYLTHKFFGLSLLKLLGIDNPPLSSTAAFGLLALLLIFVILFSVASYIEIENRFRFRKRLVRLAQPEIH